MKNFSSWKFFFWEGPVKCHCLPSHSGWAKGALPLALGRAREVSLLALRWPSLSRRAKGASLLALPWPFPLERPESRHCSPSFGPSLLEEPGSGNYVREYPFRFRKIKKSWSQGLNPYSMTAGRLSADCATEPQPILCIFLNWLLSFLSPFLFMLILLSSLFLILERSQVWAPTESCGWVQGLPEQFSMCNHLKTAEFRDLNKRYLKNSIHSLHIGTLLFGKIG